MAERTPIDIIIKAHDQATAEFRRISRSLQQMRMDAQREMLGVGPAGGGMGGFDSRSLAMLARGGAALAAVNMSLRAVTDSTEEWYRSEKLLAGVHESLLEQESRRINAIIHGLPILRNFAEATKGVYMAVTGETRAAQEHEAMLRVERERTAVLERHADALKKVRDALRDRNRAVEETLRLQAAEAASGTAVEELRLELQLEKQLLAIERDRAALRKIPGAEGLLDELGRQADALQKFYTAQIAGVRARAQEEMILGPGRKGFDRLLQLRQDLSEQLAALGDMGPTAAARRELAGIERTIEVSFGPGANLETARQVLAELRAQLDELDRRATERAASNLAAERIEFETGIAEDIERLRIEALEDEHERALELLRLRHDKERKEAAKLKADLIALQEKHRLEIEAVDRRFIKPDEPEERAARDLMRRPGALEARLLIGGRMESYEAQVAANTAGVREKLDALAKATGGGLRDLMDFWRQYGVQIYSSRLN